MRPPTQGGGGPGSRGVRSTRESSAESGPPVLVRPAGRGAGDRGHGGSRARTRAFAGSAPHDAVVLPSGDRDPGASDIRAAAVPVRGPGAVLGAGGGDYVRRPA